MSHTLKHRLSVLGMCIGITMTALAVQPALADAGAQRLIRPHPGEGPVARDVLPANAQPFGYSLKEMAALTAAWNDNTSDDRGPPPASPFQILYVTSAPGTPTFNVPRGTFFYVPIVYVDNTFGIGDFPSNVEDRRQLLDYWYSQEEIGMIATDITVDGKANPLGAGYVSGVHASLPTGGSQYIVAAAFLKPLPPGRHTVVIHYKADGDALGGVAEGSILYNVNVK